MLSDVINKNCIIFNADSYKLLEDTIKKENESIIIKEDHKVDLILIDPPYLIPTMRKDKICKNKLSERKNQIIDSIENFISGFDYKIFDYFKSLQNKVNMFIFCNKALLFDLIRYFKEDYLFEILIWHKTNASPMINNTFLPDIEYILYVRDRGVMLQGDYSVRNKVFNLCTNQADKKKYGHPTIKPVEILNNLILVSTKENDLVLDCFMGSGSTGVACKKCNRKFIGIEKDLKFYEIAKNRLIAEYNKISIFDYERES